MTRASDQAAAQAGMRAPANPGTITQREAGGSPSESRAPTRRGEPTVTSRVAGRCRSTVYGAVSPRRLSYGGSCQASLSMAAAYLPRKEVAGDDAACSGKQGSLVQSDGLVGMDPGQAQDGRQGSG